jgi:hypothetical protein
VTINQGVSFGHSGVAPTGPREARPDDKLRAISGIQTQVLQLSLDSGFAGFARAPE